MAAQERPELLVGRQLGSYQIVSLLGAGGMGEVYRARDTRLGRTVAVKILPQHLSNDPVRKQRFEREAKIISSLNHPHICVLYDVGQQDGTDYLVMEYIEGETLAKRLEKGPLPLEQVVKYGAQVADALDKAHHSGIAHRDLKPGNIMLTPTGAKLLDFGLAKPVTPVATLATLTCATPRTPPVTQEGTIMGTFQYMAPEQLEGRELDARSDIFSLGAVLYEMVTGQPAFPGKTQLSVASAILEKEPAPIRSLKPMTPPALDHAIRRCLAKDPEERWQGARDLAQELKWVAEGSGQAGAAESHLGKTKWREHVLMGVAAILALATVVLGIAYFGRAPTRTSSVSSSILPPENNSFLLGFGLGGYALSPDGTRLVFSAQSVDGKHNLWLRPLNSFTAQEVRGTENGYFPFWSPDSQWIGFFADGKLKKIPASGGAIQVICDAPLGWGATWNAQGVIVFAPSPQSPLFRVSAGGGSPTPVTQMDSATGEITHRYPDFLPDGVHFIYQARSTLSYNKPSAVYAGSLDSSFRKKVLDGFSDARFADPGYLLFVRDTTLFAQHFDIRSLSLVGEAGPITGGVARLSNILRGGFDVSQSGRLIYRSSGGIPDTELMVIDRAGKKLSSLETEGETTYSRLSPTGEELAVVEYDPTGTSTTIWIYDVLRNLRNRFTLVAGVNVSPTWSPDGSQIAFASPRNGNFNVYVKPASGVAEEKILHPSPDDERPQSWSPDGRFLVIDSRPLSRQGNAEVALLSLAGDHKPSSYLNVPYANYGGRISPDGRWLAYVSTESGRPEIYVTSFPQAKGKWQVSSGGGRTPRWRRDGHELFFCRPDGVLMAVDVSRGTSSFAFGTTKPISEVHVVQGILEPLYDVFPDGQRFIMSAIKRQVTHASLTLITNWTAYLEMK
jgi:eukaryotic-like serine/threonine-protein kinase